MANRYAVATGNWSSLATWDGGASLPGAGDTVRPNGYTVTIDQDITITELRADASSPAVAGGSFLFGVGRTITGNILFTTGGGSMLFLTGSGSSRTVVGNITSTVSGNGLYTGLSTDPLIVIGNLLSTGNGRCIYAYSSLNLTLTGNVTSTSTCAALYQETVPTFNILITGDIQSTGSAQAVQLSYGIVNIVGNVTAGTYHAVTCGSTVLHSGNSTAGSTGHHAIYSPNLLVHATNSLVHQVRTNNSGVAGVLRSLYTGGVNLNQPVVANVRSGTVYGAASEYTGTLAVPSPTLVAIGVSTDNTVGSYNPSVNASDIRSAVGLAAPNLDTQLSTLATPAQVNAQVLDVLSVDTFGELGSPPAATSSLKDKLVWLFMWARNKATETSTQRKLYADDTTTVVSTETVGDDGVTFTKGEAS